MSDYIVVPRDAIERLLGTDPCRFEDGICVSHEDDCPSRHLKHLLRTPDENEKMPA